MEHFIIIAAINFVIDSYRRLRYWTKKNPISSETSFLSVNLYYSSVINSSNVVLKLIFLFFKVKMAFGMIQWRFLPIKLMFFTSCFAVFQIFHFDRLATDPSKAALPHPVSGKTNTDEWSSINVVTPLGGGRGGGVKDFVTTVIKS